MGAPRRHTQTVRLTEAQHVLVKRRFADEPGMTWQKLLTCAVNAYARDELHVSTGGVVSLGGPRESSEHGAPAISFGEDPEAMTLDELGDLTEADLEGDDLPEPASRPYGSQAEETIGTRELATLAEERTGRRVNIKLLRQLVRERFAPEGEAGPGVRYRWAPDDPQLDEIMQAIAAGDLVELRDRRMLGVGLELT